MTAVLRKDLRSFALAPDDVEALRIPARGCYDESSRHERLAWLRDRTGAGLLPLDPMRLRADRLGGNIENAIGAVEIPVGVAGPLLFDGERARGVIFAPLATTEGALIASVARGATAITRAGGVRTRVVAQRMTRAPAFEFAAAREALAFVTWIDGQLDALRACTREVSRHAELVAVEHVIAGRVAHLLFIHTTGEAAGQNMTTATTSHACQWVLAQLPALGLAPVRFMIEGNLSADKKVSARPMGEGRGCAVVAECVLDRATLERSLKVSPEALLAAHAIMQSGARYARVVLPNVNVANVVAGIFTATGQDIACVHESSLGELELHRDERGVAARLRLPALVVGTVGGGTRLPAQRALLEMMGCTGEGSARRLAEIVAGYCLALELSTLAALATGEFASAHARLGRNRPVQQVGGDGLPPAFFDRALRRALGVDTARVETVEALDHGSGASILGELAARRFTREVGVFHRRLRHTLGALDVVVKVKPLDREVELMMAGLAAACGADVADAWARHGGDAGFRDCHLREIAVCTQTDTRFTRHAPVVYDTVCDEARGAFALVLERLTGRVRLLDSADDPRGWGTREIEAATRGAAAVHAIWLGRERELLAQSWIGRAPSAARMTQMRPLFEALARHAADEFPSLMPARELRRQLALVADVPAWWARIESLPRTLAHNDFNPRNIALRDDDGALTLCAYDWELATLQLPQHDLAELLAFVLTSSATRAEVGEWVELHRRVAMASAPGVALPGAAAWREGFALAARDLLVNRFALYLMGHTQRQYAFLPRALETLRHLVDLDLERP